MLPAVALRRCLRSDLGVFAVDLGLDEPVSLEAVLPLALEPEVSEEVELGLPDCADPGCPLALGFWLAP